MIRKIGFLLVLISFLGYAQDYKLATSIDRDTLLVGEQTNYTIDFEGKVGSDFQWPIFEEKLNDSIEIIEVLSPDSSMSGDVLRISQKLVITSFDSALYQIPAIKLGIGDDTIYSNKVQLYVNTVAVDTSASSLADIKAPAEAPYTWDDFDEYIYIGLAVLLLIVAIIYILYKRSQQPKKEKVIEKPKVPAHVTALNELTQLENKKLWQEGKTKEYFSELTEILRKYLEARYNVEAMEQTSDEVISKMSNLHLVSALQLENITSVLRQADQIKFAKGISLPDENTRAFDLIKQFVEQTQLIETKIDSEE